jgi:predicted esterase
VSAPVVRTVPYTPDKLLDIHTPEALVGAPVVLLWHGSGPDGRDALAPLAAELAARGVLALVPDWQSDDVDTGSGQLLASMAFARDEADGLGGDGRRIVLAGWSLGANAALSVALHPDTLGGWAPAAVVGLGGSYSGSPFGDDLFTGAPVGGPEHRAVLAHGSFDGIVAVERSVEACVRLGRLGWTVRLRRIETDHAGIIGTVYDPWRRRCVPTDDPTRVAARMAVAGLVAGVAH